MKLLFLANRMPYPPYRGDKLKIYNLAKRLQHNHELHLLTFAQTKEDLTYVDELKKIFKEVHVVFLPKWKSAVKCISALWSSKPLQVLYFQSAEMKAKLDEVLQKDKFDAVHVQHLRMSPYLYQHKEIPRILDLPDAFSLYWKRRKTVPRGFLTRMVENIEQTRVLRYEKILESYDMSLVCSSEDLEYLRYEHHVSNINLLPNGVSLETFAPRNHDYSHNHTLLFTGNMDYAPNVDAVLYFTGEVLPEIRKKFPSVQFIIAGQRPIPKVQALANDYIKVTGFVKDLAAVYNEASVVVAPLRFGAGTQNKVLEAMAMGIPVVCSNIGFKGLGIEPGEGAFMQTEAKAFTDSVCDLLADADLRQSVGARGMKAIRERFGWDAIALQLEEYFTEVAHKKPVPHYH
ncbi:glycosyltransferase [Chitinophagaceae bacterium MMS25-I14]